MKRLSVLYVCVLFLCHLLFTNSTNAQIILNLADTKEVPSGTLYTFDVEVPSSMDMSDGKVSISVEPSSAKQIIVENLDEFAGFNRNNSYSYAYDEDSGELYFFVEEYAMRQFLREQQERMGELDKSPVYVLSRAK